MYSTSRFQCIHITDPPDPTMLGVFCTGLYTHTDTHTHPFFIQLKEEELQTLDFSRKAIGDFQNSNTTIG